MCVFKILPPTISTRQRMSGVVHIEAVSPYKATCSGGPTELGQSWSGRKSHQLLPASLSSVPFQCRPRSHPGFLLGRVPGGPHHRDMAGRGCGVRRGVYWTKGGSEGHCGRGLGSPSWGLETASGELGEFSWETLVGGRSAEPEGAQKALSSACTAPKGAGHSGRV